VSQVDVLGLCEEGKESFGWWGVGEDDIQTMEQGHGFGQGEFGLFEGVEGGADGVAFCAGEIRAGEISVEEAAAGEVGEGAVGAGKVGVLEGDLVGDAAGEGGILEREPHEGGVVEDALDKVNGFGDDEFLFFQAGVHPVDADELGVFEARLLEEGAFEDGEAEIAVAEGAVFEGAVEQGGFTEGAFEEDAGGEGLMLEGGAGEGEVLEFPGDVVGEREGHFGFTIDDCYWEIHKLRGLGGFFRITLSAFTCIE